MRDSSTHIVNPHIVTIHIDTVQTTVVGTADSHIVHLSIVAAVNDEVEHRRVNQHQVMNRPVRHIGNVQHPGTRVSTITVIKITATLNSTRCV